MLERCLLRSVWIAGVFLFITSLFVLSIAPARATTSDPKLIEAAKKESGQLLVTMGLRLETAKMLFDRFEAKYPFIKVNQRRGDAMRMLSRALSEFRAGRHELDVYQASPQDMAVLQAEGVIDRYDSPQRRTIDAAFKDEKGYWTDLYWYPIIIAYNTKLVSPADAPRTWQDVLDPKWKGTITMPRDQIGWYRVMLGALGNEAGTAFMKALAKQNVRVSRGVSDGVVLLAAGEFHLAITRAQHIEIFKHEQGAPVDWVKDLNPMAVHGTPIAVTKHSPNPNSARLLIDFLLSEEAAQILAESRRLPPRLDVKGLSPGFREMNRKNLVRTPDEDLFKNFEAYRTEFRQLFGMPR